MTTITELVYEPINSKYGWAKYGDFTVLMDRDSGYINATKLCADGGKAFKNYNQNKYSHEIILELSSSVGIPTDGLTQCVVGGDDGRIRGTYLHPLLIPALATWINAKFAIQAAQLINEHLVREYKWEIASKTGKIVTLENKVEALFTELQGSRTDLRDARTVIDKMSNQISKMDHRLMVANENIIETLDTLGVVSNKQVPFERIDPSLREQFVVTQIDERKYRVIRAQQRATSTALRKIKTEYPDARVVLSMDSRPNSKELWNAIKLQLKEVGCTVTVNDVTLGPASEATMLQIIQKCNNEKFDSFISARTKAREAEEKRCADTNTEGETESVAVEPVAEEEQKETAQTLLMRTIPQLLELARQTGRRGFSKLKKLDLVSWLLE